MTPGAGGGIALVVGGANGLGAASARALARAGTTVVVADLSADAAAEVAAGLPGTGHAALAVDVSDENSVGRVFEEVEARIGSVRVMVDFAGLLIAQPPDRTGIAQTSLDEWERTFAVNARGAFLLTREMLCRRRARPVEHGRIILFSSLAAQVGGYRGSAAYSASKGAVLSLMKAAAREGGPLGITANALAPGLIETRMLRLVYSEEGSREAEKAIPLGRVGDPDEIAATIAFIASPASSYMTGATFDVNGGLRMQ